MRGEERDFCGLLQEAKWGPPRTWKWRSLLRENTFYCLAPAWIYTLSRADSLSSAVRERISRIFIAFIIITYRRINFRRVRGQQKVFPFKIYQGQWGKREKIEFAIALAGLWDGWPLWTSERIFGSAKSLDREERARREGERERGEGRERGKNQGTKASNAFKIHTPTDSLFF